MGTTTQKPNFIDHIHLLFQWRKLIIVNFLIVSFLAAGVSLILPKAYKGTTTILPPVEDSGGLGLSSLISNLPIGNLGGMGMVSEETYNFLAILNSRTLMTSVANKYNLIERYKCKDTEKTVKTLREHVWIAVNDDGTISLSAEAATPFLSSSAEVEEARHLSMNMANFFIKELDRINKTLKVDRASNTRQFIERRYTQNLKDLANAEDKLQAFQESNGTVALPEQTAATISAMAELQAQIIAKEVEIESARQLMGGNHSLVLQAKNQRDALLQQLKGMTVSKPNKTGDVFLPLDDIPVLGLQYARLLREVMLQQKITEFILPQYEQAKIQEAKDTPTVQILDKAVLPVKRAKPKRAFFVIFWAFLSILISTTVILTIESLQKLEVTDPDKHKKIQDMLYTINHELNPFRRKHKQV